MTNLRFLTLLGLTLALATAVVLANPVDQVEEVETNFEEADFEGNDNCRNNLSHIYGFLRLNNLEIPVLVRLRKSTNVELG